MLGNSYIKEQNYKICCFDFEGTSLNLLRSLPWQLCWCIANRNKVEMPNDKLLDWPDFYISRGAARVSGFDKEDYDKRKLSPRPILKGFVEQVKDQDNLIVGHNILGYDVFLLKSSCEALGIELDWDDFIYRCIDTLALSRALELGISPPKRMTPEQRYCWQMKMLQLRVSASLSKIAKKLGIEHDERKLHDAAYDVKLNIEVFKKLITRVNL